MAEKQEGYQALTALATGGTFAALLYNILTKKPGTVPGENGVFHLDEEVMQILAGIAVTEQAILDEIKSLLIPGGVQGFPANCRGFTTFQVPVPAALTPRQLPNFEIPEGFSLVVKSHPLNAVGTIMYVAESQPDVLNVNTAWPLLINESLGLAVTNSSALWVAASGVSVLCCVVEQR
jgi:hypothetical protein